MSRELTIEITDHRDDYGTEWRCVIDLLADRHRSAWYRRARGTDGPWSREYFPPPRAIEAVSEALAPDLRDLVTP